MTFEKSVGNKIGDLFKGLYKKLVRIDDSPQKIALGFAVGVFMGIMPGVGPVAALVVAIFLRVNRVAAFTGGLLTNAWISFITLVLAIKIGCAVLGLAWSEVLEKIKELLKDFHFKDLLQSSILEILSPLVVGYVIIGLAAAAISYFVVLAVLVRKKKSKDIQA